MGNDLDYPPVVLAIAFVAQSLAAYLGDFLHTRKVRRSGDSWESDFSTILPATLTLLGLIVGFSFSMSVSRYDQRKVYEEAEANAIGTEYVRADLLPATEAAQIRDLLLQYTKQRVLFYQVRDRSRRVQIDADTSALQDKLWSTIKGPTTAQPTPLAALVVSGMNDVLNSQGYTQAAWWNRIPVGAWMLMGLIAVTCNLLFGYSERRTTKTTLLILPLLVGLSLALIADIDSPLGGVIRVTPQNLLALEQSLKPH
jgi:hypothetical protein